MGTRAEAPSGQVLGNKCWEAQGSRNFPGKGLSSKKYAFSSHITCQDFRIRNIKLLSNRYLSSSRTQGKEKSPFKERATQIHERQGFQPTLTHRIPHQKPILITEMLSYLIALPLIMYQGHKKAYNFKI